ncbi:high mobility group B protein 13-like isoform X1 [Lycium ferocissimum]|uniref:high mobility group B protein 13-like isoform X1 n=1 Tax=Lycium ferocissimum TaxID=112874 RepID=UPI0028158414|nr:high mobility group B protein 13-like isoform X1 [Lycium ferocissimum]XP_059281932.1 high mobility group B protein 13-like isoform X1 [Lycium ferocissimum]XP_059281941.1 high mobility group B protein 13-like isoform X1 [Lycium ferocissimum]XP_059281946.1 high mobility group B protein 13-like isoform X1 [Lycium ferocissimum]
MEVDPDKHPSFRMHLFKEGFMENILMPSHFVKKHKKMLAKTCILKTDVAGISWKVKIEREKPNYFICEGDWPQFVVHHQLKHGDVLLFFLIEKSTFHVLLYSQKQRGNLGGRQLFEELSSSSEEEGQDEEEKEDENIEVSRKLKKVKMKRGESSGKSKWSQEPIDISDFEEECVNPSRSSKDGGNPGFSRPEVKSDAKADNMLGLKKKAPKTKEAKKVANDPDKPKRPTSAFYVKRGRRSAKYPDKPKRPAGAFFFFLKEFRKQFKKENPKNKSVATVGIAGGNKWKQLSNAEKAPYVAEAKKRMAEYHKNKDTYYNKRVAAGSSEEEESYKSMSEVDAEEEGEGEEEVEKEEENNEASRKLKKVKMEPRESSVHKVGIC